MKLIQVKVREFRQETSDTYSLVLERHPELASYEAGQFVNVHCQIGEKEVQRSYSFSSAPSIEEFPVLTIKRVPQGEVSNFLFETVNVGSTLTISQPLGRFVLDANASAGHSLMLAGGSGITPIFGLIKEGLHRSNTGEYTLIYANRNEDIIFQKAIEKLITAYPDRLQVHYFLENGKLAESKGMVHEGRLSLEFLSGLMKEFQLNAEKMMAYACGPGPMMDLCLNWLGELSVSPEQIRTENFTTSLSLDENDEVDQVASSRVHVLNLKGEEIALEVPQNKDILTEFLERGYAMPHSCREAMCGSCEARLVEGEVDMRLNYALTDAKLKDGLILLCQSFPISEDVTIEYAS
ncbi:MAG: ferredoxin--NADP reductase [Bacteroidota bacterium]|nr:ferredoxin--NADP reductase [Bacteroidota bacterium]MDX5430344.1 ferredoxin--NADP reductase [Bacteroidota bacterium]MDX5469105.1 ferredoxin--NADP reductase [Bacteroidota bacterium]